MMTPATPCTSFAIPGSWDWLQLRSTIEQARGRPLLLATAGLPSSRSSLWIAADDIDLIVYPDAADQAEQARAIAHQAAHILLGHQAAAGDAISSLFPHLAPKFAGTTLTIFRFSATDELAADNFACRIVANTRLPGSLFHRDSAVSGPSGHLDRPDFSRE
jgi:hypothetical protein